VVDGGSALKSDTQGSVSGLCLMVRPEHLDAVEAELRELPWLEIHARDDETGKLIVVQEHETVKEHQDGLRTMQTIPNVLTADLVVHHRLTDEDGVTRGVEEE